MGDSWCIQVVGVVPRAGKGGFKRFVTGVDGEERRGRYGGGGGCQSIEVGRPTTDQPGRGDDPELTIADGLGTRFE